MQLILQSAGYCADSGKDTQKSGCAISCTAYIHDTPAPTVISIYEVAAPLGNQTLNQAELTGTIAALLSVSTKYHQEEVELHTVNPYVQSLLNKGPNGWTTQPHKNQEKVEQLRDLWTKFTNIKLIDKIEKRVSQLAKRAAITQTWHESREKTNVDENNSSDSTANTITNPSGDTSLDALPSQHSNSD